MPTNQALISIVESVFDSTDKDFIVAQTIETACDQANVEYPYWITLTQLGWKWKTMVVSGHGFLPEYQEKYDEQAVENIPQIYFGPGGFEDFDVKGGVAYVLIRK